MPKTTKSGTARKSELPSTLQKSPAKAQRTFAKAHDAAVKEYGEGQRAHRVAYSALKHSFEKVGDHWEPKSQKGPSDQRARSGGPNAKGTTAEGVGDQEGQPALDRPQTLGLIASPQRRNPPTTFGPARPASTGVPCAG
jgi:cation transport regulator ChaB